MKNVTFQLTLTDDEYLDLRGQFGNSEVDLIEYMGTIQGTCDIIQQFGIGAIRVEEFDDADNEETVHQA